MHVKTQGGLLILDQQLENAADALTTLAMAADGLQARCDQGQDVYAAQLLEDAAKRLRLLAATVASIQGSLGRLVHDGEDLDATAELGPPVGRPYAYHRQRQEPC